MKQHPLPLVKPIEDRGAHSNLHEGERVRPLRSSDLEHNMMVECPHCNQMLSIERADGPFVGVDPSTGRFDDYFVLTLEDGATARFWTCGKGIVEKA